MLRELYQETILDHNRHPRNRREMPSATHFAEGYNPLCGDRVVIYLEVVDDKVEDVSFVGEGCAISTASASLMTEVLKGQTLDGVAEAFQSFHGMATSDTERTAFRDDFERLEVFSGVKEFPSRVKCATLAWHTLNSALHGGKVVSTE